MTIAEWRKPCEEGCTCGRHRKRETVRCEPGCACPRHQPKKRCAEGCTCKRHGGRQKCPEGCACKRHQPSPRKYTDEERAIALEAKRERDRQYMRDNRHRFADGQRARNKTHGRRYWLKHKFGLSLEQFDQLLIDQAGRCYLCTDPLVDHIAIDHDHSCCSGTKTCGSCIRGLACRGCNTGIGHFRDDPERMRQVADALESAMKGRAKT